MPHITALTLSIAWGVLAAAATCAVLLRKGSKVSAIGPARDSGTALVVLATIYSLALLAGFLYLSRFLVSSL